MIGHDRLGLTDKQIYRKKGDQGEPVAVRNPLGWTVHGSVGQPAENRVHVNLTRTSLDSLNIQLERMYDEEYV